MPNFDLPDPFAIQLVVQPEHIDVYDHVNNSIYLTWFDRVAWAHSAHLGISLEECVRLRRGMAAHRTEIDYVVAALLGDEVTVATWIVSADQKLRVERRFQVIRKRDAVTLARARTDYVCINLDSGRAARMPQIFSQTYRVSAADAAGR